MNRTKIITAGALDLEGNGYYCVVAEAANGARFVLTGFVTRDKDRAYRMGDRVSAKGSINADLWVDGYPRYGSEAYEAEAAEAYMYAGAIRAGLAHEDDAPSNIRTLL